MRRLSAGGARPPQAGSVKPADLSARTANPAPGPLHTVRAPGPLGAPKALTALTAAGLLTAAGILAALLTLAGCAGAPGTPEAALTAEEIAAAFDEAQNLLIQATPAALEACAGRMGEAGLPQPRASELAALAGGVYRLLYPESSVPMVFPPPEAYSGPYRQALVNAANGEPPPPGWTPSASEGAGEKAAGGAAEDAGPVADGTNAAQRAFTGFLDRVMPALYLARLERTPAPGSGAEAGLRLLEPGLVTAREEFPRSLLPPYLLGRLFEHTGRESASVRLYQDCLTLADSFYPARQRLAVLYLARKQAPEAIAQLELLRVQFPQDPGLRSSLIAAYLHAAAPAKAAPLVAEALMETPESREHLYLRAEMLLREGNWSQALKPLALLLLNHPEAREGYLLTAQIRFEHARDIESALEIIREAEARFPDDPTFPELAGSMLLTEGRSDEGLEQLRRTLELEPGRLSALRLVAGEAMRLQRWVQASRSLQEILAQEETAADLGDAFTTAQHLGDRELALQYAQKLFALAADDGARLRYAGALLAAGRLDEAQGLVDQGVDPAANADVLSKLLFLQARLQEESDPEQALRTLQRALIADPDNEAAVRRLAELYLLRGQLREARLFLRTAVQQNPGDAGLQLQLQQVEQALESQDAAAPAD